MNPSRLATGLAGLATGLAAVAAAAGLATDVYRDLPAMVDQARAADLATLFLAVPALAIGLWRARRGSRRARLVVAGSLAYLVYTYAIYAFQVVISPVTPVHITILGLAAWSLLLGAPSLVRECAGSGDSLPRRMTAGFLAVVAILFAGLWLGQIASAITSGTLPIAVSELGLPTSAVYALDLAFALPLLALAAGLLVRRRAHGSSLALAGLVFSVEMALSVFTIFAIQASRGELSDPSVAVVFALIAGVAAVLAATGLAPNRTAAAAHAAGVA